MVSLLEPYNALKEPENLMQVTYRYDGTRF